MENSVRDGTFYGTISSGILRRRARVISAARARAYAHEGNALAGGVFSGHRCLVLLARTSNEVGSFREMGRI